MATKKTRAEKVKETKELALNIDATTEIGMVEMSTTQAMRVSIIRSKGDRYTAITHFYRKKFDDMWKPKGSLWIPLEHTGQMAEFLTRAAEKIREEAANKAD